MTQSNGNIKIIGNLGESFHRGERTPMRFAAVALAQITERAAVDSWRTLAYIHQDGLTNEQPHEQPQPIVPQQRQPEIANANAPDTTRIYQQSQPGVPNEEQPATTTVQYPEPTQPAAATLPPRPRAETPQYVPSDEDLRQMTGITRDEEIAMGPQLQAQPTMEDQARFAVEQAHLEQEQFMQGTMQ